MNTIARLPLGFLLSMLSASTLVGEDKTLDNSTAHLVAPFVLKDACISQPIDTAGTNGGRAEFSFNMPRRGVCVLSLTFRADAARAPALCLEIDSDPGTEDVWKLPCTNAVSGQPNAFRATLERSFTLAAGEHKLIVVGQTADTELQQFTLGLTLAPLPPGGLRIATAQ